MAKSFVLETLESSEDKFGIVEENEWSKLIKSRFKEGYVEGKYVGGESTVQCGFDRGYEKGFEASYPISVLKGLLAANQILQKGSNPDSLRRSEKIKWLLNEFEQKSMRVMKKNDESRSSNSLNEDRDASPEEYLKESLLEVADVSSCANNEINDELSGLKKEVLMFLKDCDQPLVVDQIAHHFEKWGLSLSKNASISTNHSSTDTSLSQAPSIPEPR